MQKKLIALAVAGLIGLPAAAQADNSNVTIYGLMDMGMSSYSGSDTHKTRTGVDSGLQSSSRIGFKGVEDIGNGTKVLFLAEFGYKGDAKSKGDTFSKRQLYLGLTGDFGTVLAGRLNTPEHTLLDSIDPFHTGTVGDMEKGWVQTSLINKIAGTSDYKDYEDHYLDNVLAYVTPNWNGFTATIAITNNAIGDEPTEERRSDVLMSHDANKYYGKRTNAKAIAFSPVYNNGPLIVGLNVHYIEQDRNDKFKSSIGDVRLKDVKNLAWDLAGAYDFGWARFSAAYGQQKLKAKTDDNDFDFEKMDDMKLKQYMIGAEIPLTDSDKIMVSAAHYEAKKMAEFLEPNKDRKPNYKTKNTKWAIGYQHDLSKRTDIYAAFAKFSKKNRLANVGGQTNSGYSKGFNVGLRHKF